jgi:REP element-mobilizing transposase RayT
MTIFEKAEDYAAFERVLEEAVQRTKMRLLAYCVLPNHWHLVVWPEEDGALSRFVGWLTLTHTQRWVEKVSGTVLLTGGADWGSLSVWDVRNEPLMGDWCITCSTAPTRG